MRQDREHPLYYLDAETLLVATYVWVDDELKALQTQGFKLPPKQRHQKATLAELLTLAIFLLLQGQDLAKGYLAAKTTLKAYFLTSPAFIGSCKRPRGVGSPGHKAFRGTRPSAGSGPQAHPPGPRPQSTSFLKPLWAWAAFGGYVLMGNERALAGPFSPPA
jgi:hypothetical protein